MKVVQANFAPAARMNFHTPCKDKEKQALKTETRKEGKISPEVLSLIGILLGLAIIVYGAMKALPLIIIGTLKRFNKTEKETNMKSKRLLSILLVMAFLALLLAGCSPGTTAPNETSNGTVETGAGNGESTEPASKKNVATFVLDADPADINYYAASSALVQMVTGDYWALYNTETKEYEPRLIESWEHNEDFTEWTMHVRKGVKWHDGVELTAYDMKFTKEYMANPNLDIVPST